MKVSCLEIHLISFLCVGFVPLWITKADWIELPKIAPPNRNPKQGHLTTPVPRGLTIKTPSHISPASNQQQSNEYSDSGSFVRSNEDGNSGSVELNNKYLPRPWKTKPFAHRNSSSVPNSGHNPKNYYRWRNASFSRVQSQPNIDYNVDYTILNPDVVSTESEEQIQTRYTYPKTVIISSRTPLVSHFPSTTIDPFEIYPVAIDTKIDTDILSTTTKGYRLKRNDTDPYTDDITLEEFVEDEEFENERGDTEEDDENLQEDEFEEGEYDEEDQDEEEYDELDTNEAGHHPQSVEKNFITKQGRPQPTPPPPPPPQQGGFLGFLQFLRNIQKKIAFGPSTPLQEKVSYLQNLSNTVAADISK